MKTKKNETEKLKEKKTVGMVIAVQAELKAVFREFGEPKETVYHGTMDFHLYENDRIRLVVAHCGAGEIGAAAATQLLISLYHVDLIANFGIVGGLTEEMAKARTVVVGRVVHYAYDTSGFDGCEVGRYLELPDVFIPVTESFIGEVLKRQPSLKRVTIASADRFVASAEEKQAIHEAFQADVCDMESAGIALTCYRNQTPVLMVKTVSDSLTGGPEEFRNEAENTAELCLKLAFELIGGLA